MSNTATMNHTIATTYRHDSRRTARGPFGPCGSCGATNAAGTRFCGRCGAAAAPRCPQCDAAVREDQRFCTGCGTQLGRGDGPCPIMLSALSHPQIAGAVPDGERKQVTVLFADLKGSLELLADRDPEDARRLIQPVLEHMIAAVQRYAGTVNQVLGDGVMALFGAPVAHEDHALRACHAALDMHEAIRRHAEAMHRIEGLPLLQVRIGLNSGEAVVGAMGTDLRAAYTAVGQTTHLAARMEQLASPGTTLLTHATLQLVEGYVAVRPHGQVQVKGLREALEVYELTGRGVARSRLHVAAARGLSAFVGRADELATLERALARAASGRGQALTLVGEPGVGKSRLVREFTRSHRTRGWALGETRCLPYARVTAYQPVIHLMHGYFGIDEDDDPPQIRRKVVDRLTGLDEGLRSVVTPILGLLDAAGADAGWTRLEPLQRRQRILDATRRVLLREAQAQPLVLVFEDLHWIDSETEALLEHIVDSLPHSTILLLLTCRPGYQPPWAGRSHSARTRVERLPLVSAGAMADALMGSDPALDAVKQLLLTRTEGNPLFLEESVRSLEETGALSGARGSYRLAAPLTQVQVPATVQSILAARIDRLPEQHKRLLQSASVIGKDVPLALLLAIGVVDDEGLRTSLAWLEAAELIHQAGPGQYSFKHALTQEVAYGSLLLECRKALHGAVVAALEQSHVGRLAEHSDALATHAIRGELWGKAALYSRLAGARALDRSANREAVVALDQALDALARLPRTEAVVAQDIDIRCELRNALYTLGELGRLHELLRDAVRLCEQIGDRARFDRVAGFLTHYLWAVGRHREAAEIGRVSLGGVLPDGGCDPRVVVSNWAVGQVYHALGQYRTAVEFFSALLARVEPEMMGDSLGSHGLPAVFARSWMTRALAELGRFDEAMACGGEGLRTAERLDHPFSLYVASQGLGYLQLRRGCLSEAVPLLQRSLELCREWNLRIGRPTAAALLGYAYVRAGRLAEGTHLLSQALDQAREIGVRFALPQETGWLAEAQLRAGNLDVARNTAAQALHLAVEQDATGCSAWILRLQGEIAAAQGESAEARERFEAALQQARSLEMLPLVAQCQGDIRALSAVA